MIEILQDFVDNSLPKISKLLRSHYRNYGEHKGLAVLNSELSKLRP